MHHIVLFLLLSATRLFSTGGELVSYGYGRGTIAPGTAIHSPITKAQVFGERCSGTNFLEQLILRNFEELDLDEHYGHKHFPCWFAYPYDEAFYGQPLSHYTLEGCEEVIFFIIFRDPYDWVRSLYSKPHYAIKNIRAMDFSSFIRTPWLTKGSKDLPWVPAFEVHPATRLPFKNILHLRTARIQDMLLLKDLVPYAYFINYETLREHPQEVLKEVAELFSLGLAQEFVPVEEYKGKEKKGEFKGSHYKKISPEDTTFINNHLNKKLESSIGYTLKDSIPKK